MRAPETLYETDGMSLKNVFLSDDDNAKALDRYVNVCTDVMLIDDNNCAVLAERLVAAARGLWWKGGGMRKGETIEASIARLMKREIGYVPEGIILLDTFFHQWAERKIAPCENGQHDLIFLHYVRVDEATIAKLKLDPSEYNIERGFVRYDGSQEVRPVVAKMYRKYCDGILSPEARGAMAHLSRQHYDKK